MMRVPDRAAPVAFDSTANCTFPPPEPEPPSVIVIHGTPLTAVHVHPPDVPTETIPTPPTAGIVCDVGLMVKVQPLSCATVTVRPATVTIPVRADPVLAAKVRSMAPFPVPPAVPTITIHAALLAAVHAHDAAAPTSTRAPPPPAADAMFSGDTTNEQPVSCDTVNVCPAIVAVPERGPAVFSWIEIFTVPLPVPEAPELIPSQAAALDAVHPQPPGDVTLTFVVPAAAGTDTCPGEIENEQFSACETVNVRPPMLSVPCRSGPLFAATVNPTEPLPVPLAPDVIDIQPALLVAVQPQPLPALTSTEPLPPLAATLNEDVRSEIEQPLPCVTVNVRPPAVIAALRDGPLFRAAAKRTVPSPVPLAPDKIVSHDIVEVAVQPQPALV